MLSVHNSEYIVGYSYILPKRDGSIVLTPSSTDYLVEETERRALTGAVTNCTMLYGKRVFCGLDRNTAGPSSIGAEFLRLPPGFLIQ